MQWMLRSRGSSSGYALCILRRSPAFCGRPHAPVQVCVRRPRYESGTRGLYATRGTRFNDSTGDGPSLRGGLKMGSPKTRKGPCVIIFRPRWENHRGSVATAMVQLFRTGTSPVPQRFRGDSGICSSLHFAGVPGKQQVSRPGILRGFRFSQARARRLVVLGIRNSCIGEITLPTRLGGVLPGFGVAAPAQAVSSATLLEAYLKGLYNLERAGQLALDPEPHLRSLFEPLSGGKSRRDALGARAAG